MDLKQLIYERLEYLEKPEYQLKVFGYNKQDDYIETEYAVIDISTGEILISINLMHKLVNFNKGNEEIERFATALSKEITFKPSTPL